MSDISSSKEHEKLPASTANHELLYFWALGDLHYRAHEQWQAIHSRRLAPMFEDLRSLWQDEGFPAFCVSPGDIVDTGAPQNYQLAKMDLAAQLGNLPFYPGIGNHEFHPERNLAPSNLAPSNPAPSNLAPSNMAPSNLAPARGATTSHIDATGNVVASLVGARPNIAEYSAAWGKPVRYAWTAGEDVICIMLDQPDPYQPGSQRENPHVIFSPESLSFLESMLAKHSKRIAIIFAHCPLRDTVLDRDPERNLDDDSQDPFFYVENSQEVRAILAQHRNAALYISGHTHSGWGSPNLVLTEMLGDHPVTHVNLMSPWYTGRWRGPRLSADRLTLEYHPDDPDVLATFAVRIYRHQVIIRVRDHRAEEWMGEWVVPI